MVALLDRYDVCSLWVHILPHDDGSVEAMGNVDRSIVISWSTRDNSLFGVVHGGCKCFRQVALALQP